MVDKRKTIGSREAKLRNCTYGRVRVLMADERACNTRRPSDLAEFLTISPLRRSGPNARRTKDRPRKPVL